MWIRISGSMPLTNADPDPSSFILDLQDANKKVKGKKKSQNSVEDPDP
jgi:hypothetical protein